MIALITFTDIVIIFFCFVACLAIYGAGKTGK